MLPLRPLIDNLDGTFGVQLSRGQLARIDATDCDLVGSHNWHAHWNKCTRSYYAVRNVPPSATNPKQSCVQLSRVIMGVTDPKVEVDHRNHDTLDNRRDNLRLASRGSNQANTRAQVGCSSQFRGVSWKKSSGTWVACIRVRSKLLHLGYFREEISAALAYDAAARKYFGEFANPNFPDEWSMALAS